MAKGLEVQNTLESFYRSEPKTRANTCRDFLLALVFFFFLHPMYFYNSNIILIYCIYELTIREIFALLTQYFNQLN